ncbi:DUF2452 domain-containing protein, partial [Aquimarina pacifica]|uniref:DUF2452 domain-containing protein n=1 Tax=Aquimarina pacifica TaxID=1296415 RepID=UPI00047036B5
TQQLALIHNNLIYNAKFTFEPIVGETYYLYRKKDETVFLSILAPEECSFNYIGTFRLTANKIWDCLHKV